MYPYSIKKISGAVWL